MPILHSPRRSKNASQQQKTTVFSNIVAPKSSTTVNQQFIRQILNHEMQAVLNQNNEATKQYVKDTQTEFADYVAERFILLNAQNESLPLKLVGFEVEGKHFWVYQETAQPPELEGLKIRHDALRDLWPSQVNTINIEGNGDLQTLTFTDSVRLLEVEF